MEQGKTAGFHGTALLRQGSVIEGTAILTNNIIALLSMV